MRRLRMLVPSIAAALVLGLGALAGCSPTPEPSPSPTAAFASEEEAFAAAEETYRAYNDAGNSNADADVFLTGKALDGYLETNRYLTENGLTLAGDSVVESFIGIEADIEGRVATVTTEVCLDVSQSRVLDAEGMDVTPADRAGRWLLTVTVVGTPEALLISDSSPVGDRSC